MSEQIKREECPTCALLEKLEPGSVIHRRRRGWIISPARVGVSGAPTLHEAVRAVVCHQENEED